MKLVYNFKLKPTIFFLLACAALIFLINVVHHLVTSSFCRNKEGEKNEVQLPASGKFIYLKLVLIRGDPEFFKIIIKNLINDFYLRFLAYRNAKEKG